MKRSEARRQAFLLTYEKSFKDDETVPEIVKLAIEARDFETDEFAENLACGVADTVDELDEYIDEYLVGWKSDRISKIDKAILRIAIYEMLKLDDIPEGVSINEAVELAKEFSSDEAPSFINGILGSIAKNIGDK